MYASFKGFYMLADKKFVDVNMNTDKSKIKP